MDKEIRKYLDLLWSRINHVKYNETCQWCGTVNILTEAHHIFNRRHLNTRWILDNGILLCKWSCHIKAHKHPEDFRVFIIFQIGLKLYNKLYQESKVILADIDFEKIEQVLLKEMELRKIPAPPKPRRLT